MINNIKYGENVKQLYELCHNVLNKKMLQFGEEHSDKVKRLKLLGLVYLTKERLNKLIKGKDIIESDKNKRLQYLKVTKLQLNYFIETNKKVEFLFDTLKIKRKFKIRKVKNSSLRTIKLADIGKITVKTKKKYIQVNGLWEYYISECPLWDDRLRNSKLMKNKDFIIDYKNDCECWDMLCCVNAEDDIDDLKEVFYEKYDYELQEQSKETIMMAL